ncbi:hypothetical protein CTAYLR_007279 [Chrysophaeum taylorii]|uniref:Aminotransferase class V domain-containing protein n=1 Tax=Chrysophaeum taylorii TaxID=2483200 RepID=A0AAD7XPD8_9STRA|nr:hypothetical protein CTAYLR_007279 [Chrysophaeum taylorii]
MSEWVLDGRLPEVGTRASQTIGTHGVACVREMLRPEECEELRRKASGYATEMIGLAKRVQPMGVGSARGFDEVVLRSPGRYDVPVPFELFGDEASGIEALARTVLEGEVERAFCGVVVSEPGSPAQEWHVDSLHTSAEHAPAHLVNLMVALDDVDEATGPTEFVLGSHKETNHLARDDIGAELAYQHASNSPEAIGCCEGRVARTAMERGTLIAFDDRVLHRGGANQSGTDRVLAYFSYRRRSFTPTTHFEAVRSLRALRDGGFGEYVENLRSSEFPGIEANKPAVLCDGAGGSQVHASAIEAVSKQLVLGSANVGGVYATSRRVDATVLAAREAAADLLNGGRDEIVFGTNATTLNAHVGNALFREIKSSSNIVVSAMDHDSNSGLWARFARRRGIEVRRVALGDDGGISPVDIASLVDENTWLVAVGMASNALGTINDVKAICRVARDAGALSYVDGVHAAPHVRLDVEDVGCDFAVVSPYKFFGPHLGILWGRRDILDRLDVDKLEVSDDRLPRADNCFMSRLETGTLPFENLAGMTAAVDYIASLGHRFGGLTVPDPKRSQAVQAGYGVIAYHEDEIKRRFLEGAKAIPGLAIFGLDDPDTRAKRTSTFSIQIKGKTPDDLVRSLVRDHQIYCTAGTHYCSFWDAHFGVKGAARLSFLHYNTLDEVDAVLRALDTIAATTP